MATALWVDAPPPPEYVDLILMRDVFHCTPAELAVQDADAVFSVLACLNAEALVEKTRAGKRADPKAD